jgi:hypothetical protein
MPRTVAESRSDPVVAERVIESIFEGMPGNALESYLWFLAAVVEYLSERHPEHWGVTLFVPERVVRLNAGPVESLILKPKRLEILIDKELAPIGTRFHGVTYKNAPGCEIATIALAELPKSLASLTESHFAALSIAAKRRPTQSIIEAHSVGVTSFLSRFLSGASSTQPPHLLLDESVAPELYYEGGRITIMVNRFERDKRARDTCISRYGLKCSVCDMNFHERYGSTMRGFIHVHHLVSLASRDAEYRVDPVNDLRPVCPNCHAVIHSQDPPLSIEQARALLSS